MADESAVVEAPKRRGRPPKVRVLPVSEDSAPIADMVQDALMTLQTVRDEVLALQQAVINDVNLDDSRRYFGESLLGRVLDLLDA